MSDDIKQGEEAIQSDNARSAGEGGREGEGEVHTFRFRASGTPLEIGRHLVQQTVHAAMPGICRVITHPGDQALVALGVVTEAMGVLVAHSGASSAAQTLRQLADMIEGMPASVAGMATGGRGRGAH